MFLKFKYRTFLALLIVFGFWFSASAQNAVKMIGSNGNETIFLLTSHPKVSIEQSSLLIESDLEKITCDIDDGVRFEFTNYEEAAVNEINSEIPVFKISQAFIEGDNLLPGSDILLYDMKGSLLKSLKVAADGHISIDISDLQEGVYVINSSVKKFKLYQR